MAGTSDPFRDPQNPFADSLAAPSPYGPSGAQVAQVTGSNAELLSMNVMHSRRPEPAYTAAQRPQTFYGLPGDRPKSIWARVIGGRRLILLAALLVAVVVIVPLIIFIPKRSAQRRADDLAASGLNTKVPNITSWRGLIDPDTPQAALTSKSIEDGSDYVLVFSDEFNVEGRSFYPGDDPFWEGVNLHYWQTNNLEWYDPKQITTRNGSVEFRLEKVDDITKNYNMSYSGGMMATWNRFCFTGGRLETSVMLPGENTIVGLWPAVWTLGNLGRVGYGATLDGLWPYSYDECDLGTLANQTMNGLPEVALTTGPKDYNYTLSYLPGQRLSRCTCKGEDHPGPIHQDGTYVGRSAPEIDLIEATVEHGFGVVSQSSQLAPFDDRYIWNNLTTNYKIGNTSRTHLNDYLGGVFQQAVSAVTQTNQGCYEVGGKCFSDYMFEYKPGFDGAYISWVTNGALAWTLRAEGQAANPRAQVSRRPIPQEPMYLLANLGISRNFGGISENLVFPATMRVDYIRVYQPKNAINIGCDPKDFPTSAYIERHKEAYFNPNFTTWVDDFKQKFPKNKLIDKC